MPPFVKGAARSAGDLCQGLCQSHVVQFRHLSREPVSAVEGNKPCTHVIARSSERRSNLILFLDSMRRLLLMNRQGEKT